MSKTKAGGKTKQKSRRPGKRLGVKLFGGQKVKIGQVIIRQRGSHFHAGLGVGTGRDFTIYAAKEGIVTFKTRKGKQEVCVV